MKRSLAVFLIVMIIVAIVPSMAESWICPTCAQENTGNFCGQCGTARPDVWTCPNCNQMNTTPFCTNCGTKKPEMSSEENDDKERLDYNAISANMDEFIVNLFSDYEVYLITVTKDGETEEIGKCFEGKYNAYDQEMAVEYQLHGHTLLLKFRKDDVFSEEDMEAVQKWVDELNKKSESSKAYIDDACSFYYEYPIDLSDDWEDDIIVDQVIGFSVAGHAVNELISFVAGIHPNTDSEPVVTQAPEPTPKPTATPEPQDECDIPDLGDYVTIRPLLLGQKREQRSTDNNSHHWFYTYDYYDGSIDDDDIEDFLKAIENKYDFVEVDHTEEVIWDTSYSKYYYYYVGITNASPLMVGDKKKYGEEYNLLVSITKGGNRDHSSVTVRFSPELSYGGSDRNEGEWLPDSDAIHPAPPVVSSTPSDITPTPGPTPKPVVKCVKCHGKGVIACPQCDGRGYRIEYDNSAIGGKKGETQITCTKCHRLGEITCPRCHGTKYER